MQELWSSASYEPHLLSVLFAFAPVAMSIVIAYAFVMRGASQLRGWLLLHFGALLPYAITMTLSPSITSKPLAHALFRVAGACIPMAAAAGAGFQYSLMGRFDRARIAVWLGVAAAFSWIVIGAVTDKVVVDVHWVPAGFWYADAGPWVWLALLTTLAVSLPGFLTLTAFVLRMPPSDDRRQLRLVLLSNYVTYTGLVDVGIAYGLGPFPVGWLLSGIGSLLVVRALIVEDLLRARAFDTTAPRLVLHLAVAIVLGAIALAMLEGELTWWGAAIILAMCYASARTTIAVIGLINRGVRGRDSTLDRLLGQLVSRTREAKASSDVARLAIDIVELGIGVRVGVLLAASEDWGWTTADGTRLADEAAPDPLLVGWLAEERGAKLAGELAYAPEDVRPLLASLFEHNSARTIVPIANRDELLGLVIVPNDARRLRGRSLAFLEQATDRLGQALVHVRLAKRAAEHAMLAREVELAAAVQQQLLPGKGPHVHADVTVVGSWLPATRCAGDFWGVYPLPGGRTLVAIGDVTGHGVASATVTAAAAAACDVVVRRQGATLDLARLVDALDAAVRRVGGGELSMTCFATIFDPNARELRFVSCGHTTPYLIRPGELHALVGRGNPLGGGGAVAAKVQQRALQAGDLVVWYTDGVVDAQAPGGETFGDRRLQRMLKSLDPANLLPSAVHATVHASVSAHRGNRPRHDDETIVVAQWRPIIASTEPAREVSG
jgi:serine phosphatase RsbU (regulator of sigma subunit)